MKAVILAAGDGSRMGNITQQKPKIFLEIAGERLYHHQIKQLAPHCEEIKIVLGHGFEESTDPSESFRLEGVAPKTSVEFEIIEEWEDKENAYTALFGLQDVHDDILLVCGDVIFTEDVINQIVSDFQNNLRINKFSAVGAIKGVQDKMTAVRWNKDGIITAYGAIEGHQEVGIFALHSDHLSKARTILEENPEDWFPIIFQKIPTKRIIIDEDQRHEINTPQHLREAQKKWERISTDSV